MCVCECVGGREIVCVCVCGRERNSVCVCRAFVHVCVRVSVCICVGVSVCSTSRLCDLIIQLLLPFS